MGNCNEVQEYEIINTMDEISYIYRIKLDEFIKLSLQRNINFTKLDEIHDYIIQTNINHDILLYLSISEINSYKGIFNTLKNTIITLNSIRPNKNYDTLLCKIINIIKIFK